MTCCVNLKFETWKQRFRGLFPLIRIRLHNQMRIINIVDLEYLKLKTVFKMDHGAIFHSWRRFVIETNSISKSNDFRAQFRKYYTMECWRAEFWNYIDSNARILFFMFSRVHRRSYLVTNRTTPNRRDRATRQSQPLIVSHLIKTHKV